MTVSPALRVLSLNSQVAFYSQSVELAVAIRLIGRFRLCQAFAPSMEGASLRALVSVEALVVESRLVFQSADPSKAISVR